MNALTLPPDVETCAPVLRPSRTSLRWSVPLFVGIALGVLIGAGLVFLYPSSPVFRCAVQIGIPT